MILVIVSMETITQHRHNDEPALLELRFIMYRIDFNRFKQFVLAGWAHIRPTRPGRSWQLSVDPNCTWLRIYG